jgi:hypothetical protein
MSTGASAVLRTWQRELDARLYVVLDAARSPDLLPRLGDPADGGRAQCLWQGASFEDFADLAPWLATLDGDAARDDALITDLWGRGAAVFAFARGDLRATRRALRRLTVATAPDGTSLLVRFYDPRTLPGLLLGLPPQEVAGWFGDVVAWAYEGPLGTTARLALWDGGPAVLEQPVPGRATSPSAGLRGRGRDGGPGVRNVVEPAP